MGERRHLRDITRDNLAVAGWRGGVGFAVNVLRRGADRLDQLGDAASARSWRQAADTAEKLAANTTDDELTRRLHD